MESQSSDSRARWMRLRPIWIVAGALGLALVSYAVVRSWGSAVEPAPQPDGSVASSIGVRPAVIRQVGELREGDDYRLRLSGEAEPNAVIVVTDRGERLRQVLANPRGQWGVTLDARDDLMALEVQLFQDETTPGLRTEETVLRLPVPDSPDVTYMRPSLILVTAPGQPTRVVQSPFGGVPTQGPLSLSVIDYDSRGGVVITGTSTVAGRVRISAGNAVIGDVRIGVGGRWSYIAGRILPRGRVNIRAELIPAIGAPGAPVEPAAITVPLVLRQARNNETGTLDVDPGRDQWQIRRPLVGGGEQTTVIFAPPPAPVPEDVTLPNAPE